MSSPASDTTASSTAAAGATKSRRASPPSSAPTTAAETEPFWRRKPLTALTRTEWESLCDGCGKCCLHKLEDVDSGEIRFTEVACRLLDPDTCRCTRYAERKRLVPDCLILTAARARRTDWLPRSCAYRLLAEGKDLPDWHPLVSGDPASVHGAGMSVRGRTVPEQDAGDLEDHVTDWPA